MSERFPSTYSVLAQHGVDRRTFFKYCTSLAALMGLEATMVPKVVAAMENKPRIPVIWLHGLECTCCSESFIRDRKSTRLNSSHLGISYAVFCLKKKTETPANRGDTVAIYLTGVDVRRPADVTADLTLIVATGPLTPVPLLAVVFFFFNDTATTEIYTLSLHDTLPISYMAPMLGVTFKLAKAAPLYGVS